MSKPKMSKFLKCPIYGIGLQLVCGADEARRLLVDMPSHYSGMVADRDGVVYLVLDRDYLTNRNTQAHELVHAAWRVLDIVGVRVKAVNHEALAYLAGWMAQELDEWATKLDEKLGAADE